jgi:CheY-like chemotaxis protein
MFKNVLFVEDEEIEQLKFRKIMLKHFPKVNVILATNGEQALGLVNDDNLKLNMILLDLNMPRMNGEEFLKLININRRLPVMVITSSSNQTDIDRIADLDVLGYFIKPLRLEEYENMITSIFSFCTKNQLI